MSHLCNNFSTHHVLDYLCTILVFLIACFYKYLDNKVVKKKHPEITLIVTVGSFLDGEDFSKGWKLARELELSMINVHYDVFDP